MTTATTDPLKEARKIAAPAGIFFTGNGTGWSVFRKTAARPVYLGKRGTPERLLSFVKRCAGCQ